MNACWIVVQRAGRAVAPVVGRRSYLHIQFPAVATRQVAMQNVAGQRRWQVLPPGLLGRTPSMVNENSVVSAVGEWHASEDYADLIAALIICPSERAWDSVRAAWLFQTADALDQAGHTADSVAARERAMALVRATVSRVAQGESAPPS